MLAVSAAGAPLKLLSVTNGARSLRKSVTLLDWAKDVVPTP